MADSKAAEYIGTGAVKLVKTVSFTLILKHLIAWVIQYRETFLCAFLRKNGPITLRPIPFNCPFRILLFRDIL